MAPVRVRVSTQWTLPPSITAKDQDDHEERLGAIDRFGIYITAEKNWMVLRDQYTGIKGKGELCICGMMS